MTGPWESRWFFLGLTPHCTNVSPTEKTKAILLTLEMWLQMQNPKGGSLTYVIPEVLITDSSSLS